eukprot:SAG31_NODE_15468_length_753_cov_1.574924_1_plen_65_part_10
MRMMAPAALVVAAAVCAPAFAVDAAEGSSHRFEIVLGLPQRNLAELERRFWSISNPRSEQYLRHL